MRRKASQLETEPDELESLDLQLEAVGQIIASADHEEKTQRALILQQKNELAFLQNTKERFSALVRSVRCGL